MKSPANKIVRRIKSGTARRIKSGIARRIKPSIARRIKSSIAREVAQGVNLAIALTSELIINCIEFRFHLSSVLKPEWRIKWKSLPHAFSDERGDVPGWVLVVLMTTGLVTGIWTLAAPEIEQILRTSLSSMNGIR